MRKIMKKEVLVYPLSKDFYIEAEKTDEDYSFWLCRNNYGIKVGVYGVPLEYYKTLRDALMDNIATLTDREYMDVCLNDLLEGEDADENFNIID